MITRTYGRGKQQDPALKYRELYSISCDKPNGKQYEKKVYLRIAESLCCTTEMNTIL